VIRFPRPGPEPLAAVLAAAGWLAAWSALAGIFGSWWLVLLGAGLLSLGAGGLVFWRARVRADVEIAKSGPKRVAR
jgi:hypothetical protein